MIFGGMAARLYVVYAQGSIESKMPHKIHAPQQLGEAILRGEKDIAD